MKSFFFAFLLLGSIPLWSQNSLERQILQSKYAVDSIIATQKAHLFKQLGSVEDLLEQGKISKDEAEQMKKDFKQRAKRRTQQLLYTQAQSLRDQLDKELQSFPADSLLMPADSLNPHLPYEKTMAQVDSLAQRQEANTYLRRYMNRGDIFSPYLALGILNLHSAGHFGDKRLSPLGSKSFELGIYTNYRLRKNDNLLHLNLGLSWLYQSFKIRDGLYYQHQAGNTLLVPYGSELTKSKFRTHYLLLPIDLEWDFSKEGMHRNISYFQTHEHLYLGVGAFVGILLDTNQKVNAERGGNTYKTLIREDLHTNRWTYGLSAHIGVKEWSLYFRYSLAPLFTGNSKGEYPFMIGIRAGR